MQTVLKGTNELRQKAGSHVGYSDWHEITQEQINTFARATGDYQWIHVDVEAAKKGPFGGPIAHGYLTLSLAPALLHEAFTVEGVSMGINYGCNKVRFPSPVPVGSKVRVGAAISEVTDVAGGVQLALDLTFEVEGQEKPACVATAIYRYYD